MIFYFKYHFFKKQVLTVQRKIIHVDMDAFYASVEQLNNPELRGKPIAVGGKPENRGVVATASYEARKFGVKSAMAMSFALKLCPQLIIVYPNFSEYKRISNRLYEIYKEYTDLVEPLSLDECYLDVTSDKKGIGVATKIGFEIKERIKSELKLTASVGVAPNKLLAKISSDINKPDGIFVIKPSQVDSFMKTLDVKRIWGVGKVTLKKLHGLGVKTCEDLQKFSEVDLIKHFGKFGEALYYYARGIDESKVISEWETKSVSAERTFSTDTNDTGYIKEVLREEISNVTERLCKSALVGKTITLKVKFSDFKQITRSFSLPYHTNYTEEVYEICVNLLSKIDLSKRKIRLIGAGVSNLSEKSETEKSLF
jgi:DNA polymerase-4